MIYLVSSNFSSFFCSIPTSSSSIIAVILVGVQCLSHFTFHISRLKWTPWIAKQNKIFNMRLLHTPVVPPKYTRHAHTHLMCTCFFFSRSTSNAPWPRFSFWNCTRRSRSKEMKKNVILSRMMREVCNIFISKSNLFITRHICYIATLNLSLSLSYIPLLAPKQDFSL